MRTFVMSDVHGEYQKYLQMLELIQFSENDELHIIGDVLDRGPNPIALLLDIMNRTNVILLAGNHEYMALSCMELLFRELTDELLDSLDMNMLMMISEWQRNGGDTTIKELKETDPSVRADIFDYLSGLELYEEIDIGNKRYILVHGGFSDFRAERPLWDYSADELLWTRPDYSRTYFKDRYIISGHTTTRTIPDNHGRDLIYRNSNHIVIDCGCTFGGKLSCLCLEDNKEYYI